MNFFLSMEYYDEKTGIFHFGPCFQLHIENIRDRQFAGMAAVFVIDSI